MELKINLKYNIGDIVYAVFTKYDNEPSEKCETCNQSLRTKYIHYPVKGVVNNYNVFLHSDSDPHIDYYIDIRDNKEIEFSEYLIYKFEEDCKKHCDKLNKKQYINV